MKKDQDFKLTSLPVEAQDPSISKEDFVLASKDKRIHEQRFQTKPTTFLKDSLRRFAKNKSSVVATFILGILVLLAIFVPIFDTNSLDPSQPFPKLVPFLEPKLFDAGTGFWDGTKRVSHIPVDIFSDPEGNDKDANWWPDPTSYKLQSAVTNKKFYPAEYSSLDATNYGSGGYFTLSLDSTKEHKDGYATLYTSEILTFDNTVNNYITKFDVADQSDIESSYEGKSILPGTKVGETALYLVDRSTSTPKEYLIFDYATSHHVSEKVNIKDLVSASKLFSARFELRLKKPSDSSDVYAYIQDLVFESESTNATFKTALEEKGFSDATEFGRRKPGDSSSNVKNYWYTEDHRGIHLSKIIYCDFTYDTYEAAFGVYIDRAFQISDLEKMRDVDKTITWQCTPKKVDGKWIANPATFKCEIIDEVHAVLAEPVKAEDVTFTKDGVALSVVAKIAGYKEKGYTSVPRYLMGTDDGGRDMFKYVFDGLRTSLILGTITSAVCFIFGLIWGAICGYYGGTVDLIMERLTDILAGIPWIVVMTLAILHLGKNFFVFAMALCLTGWIGTAATTRTQFYRFRGREYVLASRTLGASDARLIAKHILPNAMGTIITSAVLMIPSIIFSEATLAYLNLGLRGLSSLGVILSDNQKYLQTYPFLLIFPSIIIALLMISFNLFGNGLRDAVNPSLKGEDE